MAELVRFNKYILEAIDYIAANRSGLGYDIHSYFTRTLDYGGTGSIPANHPPKTMCVAAVCEIIIEALIIWQKSHADATGQPDKTPFRQLPVKSWTGGSRADIRAHIFMYDSVKCRGTANALARFGVGKETAFDQLQPGDFVNFNRSKSGHSAVFLGYIDRGYDDVPYSAEVVGFRYFSAQGQAASAPNHGFGYRWGFFGNVAPRHPLGRYLTAEYEGAMILPFSIADLWRILRVGTWRPRLLLYRQTSLQILLPSTTSVREGRSTLNMRSRV